MAATTPMTTEDHPPTMSRGMTFLFALTGAAAVGNLYWAQPLLVQVAAALHVSLAATGALITATQVGYAAGVLLLVPLGDSLNRRRLIPAMMALSAVALLASAVAPGYVVLLASLCAVGVTTVAGQMLVPLAGDLAREDQRGRVVGSIVSGILIGILTSRTISGLVAEAFGWRSIYFLASGTTLVLAVSLAFMLPAEKPRARIPYGTLLLSIGKTVSAHRAIPPTLAINACSFGVFTMFWTGLTFLLSAPPFGYSVRQIGLVGLVGLAGAVAAKRAGALHDRGWSTPAVGVALLLAFVSLGVAAAGAGSIIFVLIAVLLIDIAVQGISVLNQNRLFFVAPAARSRVNTAFVVCNFAGGALGSVLAGILWQKGGWYLLVAGQALIILAALLVWVVSRTTLAGVEAAHGRADTQPSSSGLEAENLPRAPDDEAGSSIRSGNSPSTESQSDPGPSLAGMRS